MWFVNFLILYNSLASRDFVNTYRLTFGFAFINTMDIAVGILFLVGVFFSNRPGSSPTARTHPMFLAIVGFLALGAIAGAIGAIVNFTPMGLAMRHARDYLSWPICVFAGYRIIGNTQSAWRMMYFLIVGGVITATMFLTHFAQNAEFVHSAAGLNVVRSVSYIGPCAGIAAMICVYSFASRKARLLPAVLGIPIACYCIIGNCAPLSRGEWLEVLFGLLGLLWLLPRERRWPTFFKGLLFAPVLVLALYLAIQQASAIMHRDFGQMMADRIWSLLPTQRETGGDAKAWDTRVGSLGQELAIWAKNPLLGQGFASQMAMVTKGDMEDTGAYFHNGWTSVLATTGVFGFAGFMCLIGSMLVIGRRLALTGTDGGTVMMGVVSFVGGIDLLVGALCGTVWIQRLAILFGVICGMMLKVRDIQQTAAQMQSDYAHDDLFEISEDSGPVLADSL